MRYLPNQESKARRIKPRHLFLLQSALAEYMNRLAFTNPGARSKVRLVVAALPVSRPLELRLYANEWEIVSKALRPHGSNPTPGTKYAQWFALYTLLRKTFVFRTEGDLKREQSLS